MANDPFLQEDGQTLKNTLGVVHNPEALRDAERAFTASRIESVSMVSGNFDQRHLRDIHRHIFQDVYAWAGTMRTDTIQLEGETVRVPDHAAILRKGDSTFLPAQFIEQGIGQVERLANSADANSPDRSAFAAVAGEVLSDLNHVHPFREGNGRTQRAFLLQLAKRAGHRLNFQGVTEQRNIEASVHANRNSPEELYRIVKESLDPERVALRKEAASALLDTGLNVDRSWIETPEVGERVTGTIVTRDDAHATVIDAENRHIALPPEALPLALRPGDPVDFHYLGQNIAERPEQTLIDQLTIDLKASKRPTDPETRRELAETVTAALSTSQRSSLEAGDLGSLSVLTDDPLTQKLLAFEYLRQEVGKGRTELVEAMQSSNRLTQKALPEAEQSQSIRKQSL